MSGYRRRDAEGAESAEEKRKEMLFICGQQELAGNLLRAGHPEELGLQMAASDWIAEEVILSGPD